MSTPRDNIPAAKAAFQRLVAEGFRDSLLENEARILLRLQTDSDEADALDQWLTDNWPEDDVAGDFGTTAPAPA